MYIALYRKLRPKTFNDVIGQEVITTTLKNEIKNEKIGHAYLFCGTRGTGKTSTAKIFAKAINCLNLKDGEPCLECEMCEKIEKGTLIDINELDAASNNGVDKIRDIIEEVKYPPQESRYKVYILDEVHMLSTGAVNAFLKTLEEPPKNVIFILATTDPQKLPVTILSRCQRFDFKRINKDTISKKLREYIDDLGIFASEESLNLIARISDGSMRDALSILDQSISTIDKKIDHEKLVNMLGIITNSSLIELYDFIIERRLEDSIRLSEKIVLDGKDPFFLIKEMIVHLRNILLSKISNNPYDILDMSDESIESVLTQSSKISTEEVMRHIEILLVAEEHSKANKESRINFEIALIKMNKINYDISSDILARKIKELEMEITKIKKINISKNEFVSSSNTYTNKEEILKKDNLSIHKEEKQVDPFNDRDVLVQSSLTLENIKKNWIEVLNLLKARKHMIIFASIMTGSVKSYENGYITVEFPADYALNKPRLCKEENKKNIEEVLYQVFRENIKINYTVVQKEDTKSDSHESDMKDFFAGSDFEIIP